MSELTTKIGEEIIKDIIKENISNLFKIERYDMYYYTKDEVIKDFKYGEETNEVLSILNYKFNEITEVEDMTELKETIQISITEKTNGEQ